MILMSLLPIHETAHVTPFAWQGSSASRRAIPQLTRATGCIGRGAAGRPGPLPGGLLQRSCPAWRGPRPAAMAAPAPPGLVKPIEVPPATAEDLEKFISANARWLDEGSTAELKGMNPQDQRRVIAGGTIVSCRDASGVMRSRVRQAREKEALLANARAGNANPGTGAGQVAVIGQGGVGMLSKPATSDEIEAFIGGNRRWLSEEAEELLRAMTPVDQKRVLAAGTLSGCRDPVAVVQTRAKKAREMEMEFENLTRGGVLSMPKVEVPAVPMPTFSAETGMADASAGLGLCGEKT